VLFQLRLAGEGGGGGGGGGANQEPPVCAPPGNRRTDVESRPCGLECTSVQYARTCWSCLRAFVVAEFSSGTASRFRRRMPRMRLPEEVKLLLWRAVSTETTLGLVIARGSQGVCTRCRDVRSGGAAVLSALLRLGALHFQDREARARRPSIRVPVPAPPGVGVHFGRPRRADGEFGWRCTGSGSFVRVRYVAGYPDAFRTAAAVSLLLTRHESPR